MGLRGVGCCRQLVEGPRFLLYNDKDNVLVVEKVSVWASCLFFFLLVPRCRFVPDIVQAVPVVFFVL